MSLRDRESVSLRSTLYRASCAAETERAKRAGALCSVAMIYAFFGSERSELSRSSEQCAFANEGRSEKGVCFAAKQKSVAMRPLRTERCSTETNQPPSELAAGGWLGERSEQSNKCFERTRAG